MDNKLDILEKEYQTYCSKFSPAYLSGSPWYVGPSMKEHIKNENIDLGYLSGMFYVSHKLSKKMKVDK